jgi:tetratricopeptide (TPR) repeat protein
MKKINGLLKNRLVYWAVVTCVLNLFATGGVAWAMARMTCLSELPVLGQGEQTSQKQEDENNAAGKAREVFNEAVASYREESAASLQSAIEKFEKARSLYMKAGDRKMEAVCLGYIGYIFSALGEQTKALEYYNLALPIYRAVGDRSGEAATLTNIGTVYFDIGEKGKALEYYHLALPIYRAVGDRSGEAATLNNIGKVYDDLGEKAKALEYYNLALPISRELGDRSSDFGGRLKSIKNFKSW